MKIKDLERTANIAWSPANVNPIYLAAGTAAQQLDASFSTNASLEIFALNLTEPGMEMESKANIPSEHRFHKIVWGSHGTDENGTIVAGCDNGIVQLYSASKVLNGDEGLVSRQDKHSGPVTSLDFNPFQSNLLATGAAESEIYIWDMNNTNSPMTPGAKSQPLEDVLSIQWNRQVQHILASTFSSKCVVWDLRKNEPIIKLTDTVSRIRWKVVAWHPEVATQLCLASEEDQAPIIQLWDLRFATSPLKTLENHQRGVLSIAWCAQDPDLLVSCAKDNRIVCWNPNSNQPGGEVLSEVARTNQWNFDITWCPKNPALIATPGFDGHVSVYSLMGGKAQQIQTTNKIADSFPGMDGYVQAPVAQQNVAPVSVDLTKPPKWLKKPVGARFGFGGKLLTFEHDKVAIALAQQNMQPGQQAAVITRFITISQVITEPELISQSTELEQALEYGNFTDYCRNKADSMSDQHKKYIWYYLKANFEQNPRAELLNLLGYRIDDVNSKLNECVSLKTDVDGMSDQLSNLNRSEFSDGENNYSSNGSGDYSLEDYNTIQDPFSNLGQSQAEEVKKPIAPYKILTGDDTEGLITQALLLNNIEAAVELCLQSKRFADAIIIAMTGGSELLSRTQQRYLQQTEGYVSSLISALVCEDWESVVNNCDINSWKEALAAALTHASDDDLPALCELMGSRLERESNGNLKVLQEAQLCYICAGSFDKLVASWSGKTNTNSDLQELVELVTFLQKSVERQGRTVEVSGHLADLLSKYAFILASQGSLDTALNYLGTSTNEGVASLRERLYVTLGHKPAYGQLQPRSRQNTARSSIGSYNNQFISQPLPPSVANTQFKPAFRNPQPAFNQFNTGLPNASTNQPWQQQGNAPPKPYSPAPVAVVPPTGPPQQPPRPGSVGLVHGSSGLPKSKYVVDPSVQSNQYGSRNQYAQSPLVQPVMPTQNFQNNMYSTDNNPPFSSNNTNNGAFPPSNAQFPPNNAPYPPGNAPFSQNNTPYTPAMYGTNPFSSNPTQPSMGSNQAQNHDVDHMGQSAMNTLPSSAAPGWNDPPTFTKSTKTHLPKQEIQSQDPITHPIFGSAPVPAGPTNGYLDQNQSAPYNPYGAVGGPPQDSQQQQQMFQPPPATANFSQGFASQPSQGGYNTQPLNQGFNTHAVAANTNTQQAAATRIEKPPPVPKLPMPEEHIHMQTVFDELKNQCSCKAKNPQTKRKVDDVSRKLESLYDLLREHKLSPNTLASLHQMVQMVQHGDYTGGLNIHTQLVSGSDFAQIASFMPGLKVLLQCALQLQVYLR